MAANNKKNSILKSKLLFAIYLVFLSYLLFFAESMGRTGGSEYRYNLQPLHEIKRFICHIDVLGLKVVLLNVVGNIVAFIPYGYFVPSTSGRKVSFLETVFLSMIFSFMVELLQLLFKAGSFDVDDIILNTLGGLLGYFLYKLVALVKKSRKEK